MSLKANLLQPAVAATLKKYLERNRLPHALLFLGPLEAGQREVAANLAKTIFCGNKKNEESCGECPHCRQITAGHHPDFLILEPQEGHAIKIESIRELIGKASFKPFQAPVKIFVIDHAELMNDIAQNAILKTLEEPPNGTHFILICYAAEKLLPTIRSRVQTIHFLPVVSDVAPDPEIQAARHELLAFICGEHEWKTADTVSLEREGALKVLNLAISDLRDMLILSAGAEQLLGFIEDRPLKERALNSFSEDDLADRIDVLSKFYENMKASANLKLALSVLRDELALAEKF